MFSSNVSKSNMYGQDGFPSLSNCFPSHPTMAHIVPSVRKSDISLEFGGKVVWVVQPTDKTICSFGVSARGWCSDFVSLISHDLVV
jgi:hypothetical protein